MYCSTAVCRADSGTVARLLSGVAVRTRYRGDTPAHAGRPFERIAGRALQGRAAALASCFDSSLRPGWQHYHSTRYSNLLDHGRAWIGVAWREATRLANGDDNARSAEQPRNCRSGGSGDTVRRAYLALVPRSRSGGPSSRSDDRICSTTTSRRRCYHGVRAIQRGRRPPPCATASDSARCSWTCRLTDEWPQHRSRPSRPIRSSTSRYRPRRVGKPGRMMHHSHRAAGGVHDGG